MRIFVLVLAVLMSLSGCGGGGSSSGGGGQSGDEPPLAQALTPFIYSKKERIFFAEEASAVGVSNIRYMGPDEEIMSQFGNRPACGLASYNSRTILIRDAARCRSVYTRLIAHEIAHFGSRDTCHGSGGGHGPPFFRYFRGIAERYEAQIAPGSWSRPVNSVSEEEHDYKRIDAYRCRGFFE